MKKIIAATILGFASLLALAPKAKADDCGYWAQGTRIEYVYQPGYLIGYTREGNPIWRQGYYAPVSVPYTYWVSVPCAPRYYPQPRRHYYFPRLNINFGFLFK